MRNVMCRGRRPLASTNRSTASPTPGRAPTHRVPWAAEINPKMPSPHQPGFRGARRAAADDARVNDGGFVSVVRDGGRASNCGAAQPGQGAAPGRAAVGFHPPPRRVAGRRAIFDVFNRRGRPRPARPKGRMKFRGRADGGGGPSGPPSRPPSSRAKKRQAPDGFRPQTEVMTDGEWTEIISVVPPGGWSVGVAPATGAVAGCWARWNAPLGDLCTADFDLLADIADRSATAALNVSPTRTSCCATSRSRHRSRSGSGSWSGACYCSVRRTRAQIRACTGSGGVHLGVTTAPTRPVADGERLAGPQLVAAGPRLGLPELLRPSHQIGDIGLSGSKVKLGGKARDGYQVFPRRPPGRGQARRGRRPGGRGRPPRRRRRPSSAPGRRSAGTARCSARRSNRIGRDAFAAPHRRPS